jgi:hypothetical protein
VWVARVGRFVGSYKSVQEPPYIKRQSATRKSRQRSPKGIISPAQKQDIFYPIIRRPACDFTKPFC